MANDDRFLIDQILPANQIHLISGPSGAGKTPLGLQALHDFSNGDDILGYPSHYAPFCYVDCNQPIQVVKANLRHFGIPTTDTTFPHLSIIDDYHLQAESRSFHDVLTLAMDRVPNLSLLFIDGLATLCPPRITDTSSITDFMLRAVAACKLRDVTVLGTISAVKTRTGEGYIAPRERIIGSAAFSSMSGTKIMIDFEKPQDPTNPNRIVHVMPRLAPPKVLKMTFNADGRLETRTEYSPIEPLEAWLAALASGTEFTSDELLQVGGDVGRTAVYEWVKVQVELGSVVRVSKGTYRTASQQ